MKCVGENYVAHKVMIRTIANVQRGIELETEVQIVGEPA